MTTVTSRALALIPLPLSLSVRNNDGTMHQDNLAVHNHVSQSPILPVDTRFHGKEDRMSPQSLYERTSSPRTPHSYADGQYGGDQKLTSERSSAVDECSEPRSSPMSSVQMESFAKDGEAEDDRLSCCSDDSELSVGKEVIGENTRKVQRDELGLSAPTAGLSEVRHVLNVEDTLCGDINSKYSQLESERSNRLRGEDMNDDMSNESHRNPSQISSPTSVRDESTKMPIVRPSPTRLQEEFIRNSQLYAEELMKQQISFVAATRGLNLSPKSPDHPIGFPLRGAIEEPKLGFRPHVRTLDTQKWTSGDESVPRSPEHMSFRGIHSHLNAISQITQTLNQEPPKLTSPSSTMSRESSQSPPSNPHLHHHHHHHHHHHVINNNLNETTLKFSIDNILKADFGRRITDPLMKRTKTASKKSSQRSSLPPEKHGSPMDLTASPPDKVSPSGGNTNASQSKTSSVQSSSSSSSTSEGGPMVWPAWVYCTRYSDRPSSGRSKYRKKGKPPLEPLSPRTRRPKKPPGEKGTPQTPEEKRPRTAFSGPQLARLKHEFAENRYLTERRRQQLSAELGLNEAQIKIWFQNKRAKIKKASGQKNPLALQLMAQGLYNHSTVPLTREEEELQELQANGKA